MCNKKPLVLEDTRGLKKLFCFITQGFQTLKWFFNINWNRSMGMEGFQGCHQKEIRIPIYSQLYEKLRMMLMGNIKTMSVTIITVNTSNGDFNHEPRPQALHSQTRNIGILFRKDNPVGNQWLWEGRTHIQILKPGKSCYWHSEIHNLNSEWRKGWWCWKAGHRQQTWTIDEGIDWYALISCSEKNLLITSMQSSRIITMGTECTMLHIQKIRSTLKENTILLEQISYNCLCNDKQYLK